MSEENLNQSPDADSNIGLIILTGIIGTIAIITWDLHGVKHTFWHKTFWFFGFLICNPICVTIGDALRKVAVPDVMITTGMGDTLKKKFFWAFGPQLIGSIIGLGIGALPSQFFFGN